LFDFAAVHLMGDKAATVDLRIDFSFTDLEETSTMWIQRGVLNARKGASSHPDLTVSGAKAALVGVALQPGAAAQLAEGGQIALDGNRTVLETDANLLDSFDPNFAIVTPD
jgi:alkyl sulfatase BDS1-like metallo-beta-lactamase superfamily hydrolase